MQALFRILLCFLLSTLLLPSFAATSERTPEQEAWINENLSPKETEWLNNHSTIRVRITENPPFYYRKNGIKGISIDYIELVSKYTGTKIEYVSTTNPWHKDFEEFKHNEFFDLLLAVKISEERKLNMEFTSEYIQIPMVIFTQKNTNFVSHINDLFYKTVVVPKGFWVTEQLKKDYPQIRIVTTKNVTEALKTLATNKADAYIGNLITGTYNIHEQGFENIKVAAPAPYSSHNQAMAVRKDWPELASIINKVFTTISPEQKTNIWNKYFSTRYEYGIQKQDIYTYVGLTLLLALVAITIIAIWNRKLRKEINRRKLIEVELNASQTRFRTLSDAGLEGVVFSENGFVTESNSAGYKILGLRAQDFIGKRLLDFIAPKYTETIKLKKQNKSDLPIEVEAIKKDGTTVPLELNWHTISYNNKQIRVSSYHNISLRKKVEREKEEQRLTILANNKTIEEDNRRLEKIYQNQNKFFSIISHDLKGPIGSVTNLLKILHEQGLNEDTKTDKNIIKALYKSSKNTFQLLENLLEWSRNAKNGISITPEPVDIHELINTNIELLEENSLSKTISIENNVKKGIYVLADYNLTNTIIRNLLSNAIKFTYEFGKIRIWNASGDNQKMNFCIEDNGTGISKKAQQKLFDFELSSSTLGTNSEKGTGLGLRLCKEFIGKNNGELWIESKEGKGSKFWISLPLSDHNQLSLFEKS